MICRNGAQLAANCSNGKSVASRGFFDLFYQWSRGGCQAERSTRRFIHSQKPQTPTQLSSRPQMTLRPRATCIPIRHNSTQSPIKPLSSSTEPPLSTSLRSIMRTMPHAVVVLTTSTSNSSSKPDSNPEYRGMTLSSFTTLTLTPSPIITFNIKRPSRTLDAIAESRHFLIHVLEGNGDGARVADVFTRGDGRGGSNVFKDLEVEELNADGGNMSLALPRIMNVGVVRVLSCEVLGKEQNGDRYGKDGLVNVGDHVLVLARVEEILGGDEEGKQMHGLCYADGRYRLIGDVIEIDGKRNKK